MDIVRLQGVTVSFVCGGPSTALNDKGISVTSFFCSKTNRRFMADFKHYRQFTREDKKDKKAIWLTVGTLSALFIYALISDAINTGKFDLKTIPGFLFLLAIVAVSMRSAQNKRYKKEDEKVKKESTVNNMITKLKNTSGFSNEDYYLNVENNGLVSINLTDKKVCIIYLHYTVFVYNQSEIIDCSIVSDATSVSNHLGVNLGYGIMAGGSENKNKVGKLEVKIIVNDPKMPVHRIVFLEGFPVDTTGILAGKYEIAYKKAESVYDKINILLKTK